jgi:glycosyltransferase involved in cell wall biosynthesis
LLACCTTLDYKNYEVILLDDSTDNTVERLREWAEANQISYTTHEGKEGAQVQVTNTLASMQIPIKVVHRTKRSGFKGGALNEALRHMNPDAEYVMIFDADFIPPPDIIKKSLPYFSFASSSEILAKITELDGSYADGKLDVDTYVKQHERLAAKLRGNTAITAGSKIAMKGLFTIDQLFANGEISEYEYKLRREAIAYQMAKIPTAATPYAEQPLALHRAFTVSQLFAEDKIDSADYTARIRAIFAPLNGKPHPTNEYDALVLKIIDIDTAYADGHITEDEYSSKRKELKSKIDTLSENPSKLASGFELDQALASQEISLNDYRKARANGESGKNGDGNGKHSPSGLLSFLRIRKTNGNREETGTRNGDRYEYVAVQGYQLHSLNQNENWLTAGVRAEFSGSYMIERPAQEFFGSMKMISGSVYMIRADVLRRYRWSDSITEDWELTCRLYLDGKRVAYTPTIEAAAEAPATLKRLLRQRQRWAEGHSYNVKRYFSRFMSSPNTTITEKLEYLYYTPYYIQGLILCIGTVAWVIQLWTRAHLPFWTALFDWGLLLSNSFAIPLMNFAGLVSEGPRRRDVEGVFSAIVLTYVVAFFEGYAALKGFLETKEGGWIRTYKTGNITQPPVKSNLGATHFNQSHAK